MENVLVSIFMLTYNQKEFIAQAIEGVISQETDFPYQLVIGEDFSTDGTREICQKYAAIHPSKIKLLLNKQNIGLIHNYVSTYAECTGKYVAICDGDDYWTDKSKLRKQIEVLENNPDISLVFTDKKNLFPSGEIRNSPNLNPRWGIFDDLVKGNYISSVTAVFRNKPLKEETIKWIVKYPYGDWPTYLWITLEGGKIFYLNDVTAVYRRDFGVSTGLRKEKSKMGEISLGILQDAFNDLSFEIKRETIQKGIMKHQIGLMASYNRERKFFKSFKLLFWLITAAEPFSVMKLYLYSLKRTFILQST